MSSPANVPLPSTPDLERQPLLASGNSGFQNSPLNPNSTLPSTNGIGGGVGGAQARSHIPEALRRRPSAHEQLQRHDAIRKCWRVGIAGIILALLGFVLMTIFELINGHTGSPYKHLQGSCDHIPPISPIEFEERQANLSRLLVDLRADAYIAEPGTDMRYFSNIRWSLSERPFLLVVQAKRDKTDQVLTKTTIVAPAFEASRARQGLVPGSPIVIKTWEEGESAYKVVRELLDTPWAGPDEDSEEQEAKGNKKPRNEYKQIYVDADMRQFVSSGLTNALESSTRKVMIAHRAIKELRSIKSSHEIDILRCVSTTTVNVIRAVKGQLHVGLLESEVQDMMTEAYRDAGLEYEAGGSLVLFGKDAALPHGSGNDTRLERGMMVLIDTGARLHGYISDITRTFWDKVWGIVKQAQNASLHAIQSGAACSSIDKAARRVITDQGYGSRFTHRLGHGLGMDGHEEPYLNIGNTDTAIQVGNVFTNEPGIYVEGQYGIRLEDVVLVTENGYEILSGDLATSPTEP
ncbi:hypothetical protein BGZ52_009610 [Haplosporangium bisporale]|nr:hypothetical protein BGZ52_009610 [Haplosporangium bisporale]